MVKEFVTYDKTSMYIFIKYFSNSSQRITFFSSWSFIKFFRNKFRFSFHSTEKHLSISFFSSLHVQTWFWLCNWAIAIFPISQVSTNHYCCNISQWCYFSGVNPLRHTSEVCYHTPSHLNQTCTLTLIPVSLLL